MTAKTLLLAATLMLLAACAGPTYSDPPYSASPETSAEWACVQAGGRWDDVNTVCKYPHPYPASRP
jgi:hypothetical protein